MPRVSQQIEPLAQLIRDACTEPSIDASACAGPQEPSEVDRGILRANAHADISRQQVQDRLEAFLHAYTSVPPGSVRVTGPLAGRAFVARFSGTVGRPTCDGRGDASLYRVGPAAGAGIGGGPRAAPCADLVCQDTGRGRVPQAAGQCHPLAKLTAGGLMKQEVVVELAAVVPGDAGTVQWWS